MKRLENGDIEVNGKVWKLESEDSAGQYNLGTDVIIYSRSCHDWLLLEDQWGWRIVYGYGDGPEECIDQVKLAAEHAEEL